jgi:hypothetical protein
MEFVVALLILSLLFLAAVTTAGVYLFKMVQKVLASQVDLEKQRAATTKHLANLLASKDPLAFQQVQTVSYQPETGYTGPYLSGEEIELMEKQLADMDKAWNRAEDTE